MWGTQQENNKKTPTLLFLFMLKYSVVVNCVNMSLPLLPDFHSWLSKIEIDLDDERCCEMADKIHNQYERCHYMILLLQQCESIPKFDLLHIKLSIKCLVDMMESFEDQFPPTNC